MATKKKVRKRAEALNLLPAEIRRDYEQFSFCVNVEVSKPQKRELAEACETTEDDFFYAAAISGDRKMALTVQDWDGRKLHVTLEFRKSARAPFPPATKRQIGRVVDILQRSNKMVLTHYRHAVLDKPYPQSLERAGVGGKRIRMRGYEYDELRDGDDATTRVRVELLDTATRTTTEVRVERPVASLSEAVAAALGSRAS